MIEKVKILIVDDRPENLYAMEQVLVDEPVIPISALCGEDALKACLEHDFAMAILDVQMPGMSGYELASLIRGNKKRRNLPIIFVSAVFNQTEHAFKGYESGAVDFLSKPFEPEFLRAKARVFSELYLQRKALEKELAFRCRVEKEQRIRNVQMANAQRIANLGSWFWNCDEDKVHWSDELCLLLGYSSAPSTNISSIAGLIPEAERTQFLNAVQLAQQSGACFRLDHPIVKSDGSILDIQATGEALRENAEVTQVIGTLLDVTHRKQIERQLFEAKESAEKLLAIKTEFLGMMSHEIRTPMNGLLGMIQLLDCSELDDDQREYLGIIQRTSNSLMTLLTDLLDFSKIEAGQMKLHIAEFSLLDLIQKSIHLFFLPAGEKGIRLDSVIDPDLPDLALGDGSRLGQVITNLVANGIKFTDSGAVTLKARCNLVQPDQPELIITVEDTGIGIEEDKQALVFESFAQVDSSLSRRHSGAGLGLAICRKLTGLMGGTLRLESCSGEGSSFELTIPLPLAPESANPKKEYRTLQGRRLLILDTDQSLVKRYRGYTESWMVELDHGADLDSLNQLLIDSKNRPYDWIILDNVFPGNEELALIQVLQEAAPDTPLLLTTSKDHLSLFERSKKLGLAHCIGKPFLQEDTIFSVLSKTAKPRSSAG